MSRNVFRVEDPSSNGQICNKHLPTIDENSNILNEFLEYQISNDLINDQNLQQTIENSNSKIINQKPSSTVKPTQLDAIVEDLNEENSDEINETIQPVR